MHTVPVAVCLLQATADKHNKTKLNWPSTAYSYGHDRHRVLAT